MRIILGAGGTTQEGWISTEQHELDVCNTADFVNYFGDRKADAFLAEHLFEHLTPEETAQALLNIKNFLNPNGGNLRIAVPDGYFPDDEYIDWVRPGGNGPGCDTHQQLFTCDTIIEYLKAAGYKYFLVEWWDEEGKFYSMYAQNDEDKFGYVSRCVLNDERNADGLNYTSLIIDAWIDDEQP